MGVEFLNSDSVIVVSAVTQSGKSVDLYSSTFPPGSSSFDHFQLFDATTRSGQTVAATWLHEINAANGEELVMISEVPGSTTKNYDVEVFVNTRTATSLSNMFQSPVTVLEFSAPSSSSLIQVHPYFNDRLFVLHSNRLDMLSFIAFASIVPTHSQSALRNGASYAAISCPSGDDFCFVYDDQANQIVSYLVRDRAVLSTPLYQSVVVDVGAASTSPLVSFFPSNGGRNVNESIFLALNNNTILQYDTAEEKVVQSLSFDSVLAITAFEDTSLHLVMVSDDAAAFFQESSSPCPGVINGPSSPSSSFSPTLLPLAFSVGIVAATAWKL